MKSNTESGEAERSLTERRDASGERRRTVGVLRSNGEYRLVALRALSAGERLFRIEGWKTGLPSRYSVQIGEATHIDIGEGVSAEEILDRYFWRFMNHGCEPNARVQGADVVALRAIAPWDPILYNYNTTEWEMAEPFRCGCGALNCLQQIRGFRYLSPAERDRLGLLAAPHIRRLASIDEAPVSTVLPT